MTWFPSAQSLSARLLAIFLPVVSIVLIGLFAILEYQYYKSERSELIATLRELVAIQGPAVASAVWEVDDEEIDKRLRAVSDLDYVQSAAVFDPDGTVLAQTGDFERAPEDPEFLAFHSLFYKSAGEQELLGRLQIVVHSGVIVEELVEHVITRAITLAVLILTIAGGTFYATRVVISQPLEGLRTAMQASTAGDTLTAVAWTRRDELGELVDAYNGDARTSGDGGEGSPPLSGAPGILGQRTHRGIGPPEGNRRPDIGEHGPGHHHDRRRPQPGDVQ